MRSLLDAFTVRLVLALRHAVRCIAFAIPPLAFASGGYHNGGGLVGLAVGAMIGFGFALVLAFPGEMADALED